MVALYYHDLPSLLSYNYIFKIMIVPMAVTIKFAVNYFGQKSLQLIFLT